MALSIAKVNGLIVKRKPDTQFRDISVNQYRDYMARVGRFFLKIAHQ